MVAWSVQLCLILSDFLLNILHSYCMFFLSYFTKEGKNALYI